VLGRFRISAINLGLVALAVLTTIGALELALAIMKVNTPSHTRYIPGKGTTHIPHAYYRHNKEGFSEGYFNSHGFRDYERAYEKSPGVFRILVLGDSYIEAFQVELENSFSAQLENILNDSRAFASRVEVLALGQSGFGTADEYLRYLNFGLLYDPDLVVLAFFTGNDFRNNSKFINRESIGFYYRFDSYHNLILDHSLIDAYENSLTYPKRFLEVLKTKSYLLNLISERGYLFHRRLLETRLAKDHTDVGETRGGQWMMFDVFSDLNIYRSELPPPWKEAVDITKEIILKFKRSVEARGGRFLLLSLPSAEQVHAEIGAELEDKYKIEMDFWQPDRILEEFAMEENVLFLKLMPALRNHHLKTGQYLHGFGSSQTGHWNEAGHRIAAELTSQFLRDRRLIPIKQSGTLSFD